MFIDIYSIVISKNSVHETERSRGWYICEEENKKGTKKRKKDDVAYCSPVEQCGDGNVVGEGSELNQCEFTSSYGSRLIESDDLDLR